MEAITWETSTKGHSPLVAIYVRIRRQRGGYIDNVADTQTTWRIRRQRGGYVDNVADTQTTWRIRRQRGGAVADSETDFQERLVEWNESFGSHGLRVRWVYFESGSRTKDLDL